MKAPLVEGVFIDKELVEEANTLPKCLLRVWKNGRRFIDYLIKNAYDAGYRHIVIVIHPENTTIKPMVTECLKKDGYTDLSIDFAIQHIPHDREKPFGTGDAVYQALSQCKILSGWYTLSNSDNLSSVSALRQAFEVKNSTLLSYFPEALNIARDRLSSYWVVVSQWNLVEFLKEKPPIEEIVQLEKEGKNLSLNMNLATLSVEDTFPILEHLTPHPVRNEKEVTDVYKALIEKHALESMVLFDTIPDLTSKADIPMVQKYLAQAYPDF